MISGINEILSENSALTTLLGEDKIYPVVVPQDTLPPYLAVSLLRVEGTDTKGEVSGQDYPIINVNVHADNYDEIEDVAEAVREALEGNLWTTDAGYTFTRIWYVNEFDRPDMYDHTKHRYARSVQFRATVKR